MSTYFCDGLRQVSLVNGVARLEFHRLHPNNGIGSTNDWEPMTEICVALPVQGLLQTLAMLQQVRERLVRDGVLKPTEVENVDGSSAAATLRRSPNFFSAPVNVAAPSNP